MPEEFGIRASAKDSYVSGTAVAVGIQFKHSSATFAKCTWFRIKMADQPLLSWFVPAFFTILIQTNINWRKSSEQHMDSSRQERLFLTLRFYPASKRSHSK